MRGGIVPIILGAAVTATGAVMRGRDMKRNGSSKHDMAVALGAGLVGLGAAHMVMGAIDLLSDREQ